jgi:hypothetical protein
MRQHATARKTARQKAARSGTARRILRQLFGLEPSAIDESCALVDFEGCSLPHVPGVLSPMEWRIHVKDRVYACYGVDCDVDEPLSTLVARVDLAEHGVHCSPAPITEMRTGLS